MHHLLRFGVRASSAILLVAFVSGQADSADIYTWKDEDGVLVFSDNPALAPEGIKAKPWSVAPSEQNVTIVRRTAPAVKPAPEIAPSNGRNERRPEIPVPAVSQGAFAVQLARELGLGRNLLPGDAAETLSDIRIVPPLGEWALNSTMTPALTTRLRTLTVAASQMGWMAITPEQALLAFDTAAALAGLQIPPTTERERGPSSEPVVTVPPLVYLSPPPPLLASSYTWVPVLSGFSFYGLTVHGYYALHGAHLNAHHFQGHRFVFHNRSIRSRFLRHLPEHHDAEAHVIHHPDRHERHRSTAIFPSPRPLRHRQGIVHKRHARHRQPHLRRSHRRQEVVHHPSIEEGHRLRHRASGRRHRLERQHVIRRSPSISRRHKDSRTHIALRQHSTVGGSLNGSTGKGHGRHHGGHGGIWGGGHAR